MAYGDIYIRKNTSDTSAVPNAGGGNEDAGWDTLVIDTDDGGGVFTYSDPNIQLDIGLYLIMYSEYFYTTDITTNERIEIQGEIHVSGTGVVGGYGQDYIRKASGQQECIVQGSMILDVTVNNTDVFIRFYRTDNSTTGTVNRVVGYGGVQILHLDDTDNYGFYSTSSSEATSAATVRTLNLDTNDQQDTGFSRTGAIVTVSNAGRYLATYNLDLSTTSTARETVYGVIEKNSSTEIVGTRSFCYMRGADSNQDGALCWAGVIDLAASDTVRIRWACPTSATVTAAAGATLQLWQIPSGGDECIVEATTGDYNAGGDFAWDTNPHIDTASFTHTTGTADVSVDQTCHVLAFATCSQVTDSTVQRAYPQFRFKLDNSIQDYMSGGAYHRNSSTSNFGVTIGSVILTVPTNGTVKLYTNPLGASGSLANVAGQFSLLNLESLWTYNYPPVITDVNSDEQIDLGETGISITGESFETSQGTGKIELWSDVVGTIKVSQTVTSWASDTYLEFTAVQGSLSEGTNYVVVTNNSGGESSPFAINLGRAPYNPVTSTDADLYWTMNNTYEDTGARGDNKPFNAVQRGNYSFQTVPICQTNAYSFYIEDNTGGSEPANSDYTNITNTHTYRNIGGWFRYTQNQIAPGVIYEEGGGVNNIYMLMMPNGRLMANVADSNGTPAFKHQHYSDFPLQPNRDYYLHLDIEFGDHFDLWIDGVKQTSTKAGSLGTDTTMSTHSGDWSFGDPGANLDTGGVDIAYDACNPMYLAHWGTWSGVGGGAPLSDAQIRDELFREGALSEYTISGGTQSEMQTAIETYNSQTHNDAPLTYNIGECSDGDFTLSLIDQLWPDEVKFQVNYLGENTLTVRNIGISNFSTSKAYSPTISGNFSVIETADVALTVQDISTGSEVESARVLVYADSGGDLPYEDSVSITRSGSTATVTHTSHGLSSGAKVLISGANEVEYNGVQTITVTGVNTYTYTVSGTPDSPATGTITGTSVIINGVTDVSGQISNYIDYISNQPITGWVRSASGGTKYKQTGIVGTILSTGLDLTAFLIKDE